ncbi:hypothetical protein DSECCO2_376010 [anaerobic digester metagenome]
MHLLHLPPFGKEVNIVLKPSLAVCWQASSRNFRNETLCLGSDADADLAPAFFANFEWRCLDY